MLHRPARPPPEQAVPYLLLVLAVFAVYASVYDNVFLFDDEFLFVKNEWLKSWQHLGDIFVSSTTAGFGGKDSFYRPLQILSYLLLTRLIGFSTTVFHAYNIALHAVNVCLMFTLAGRLGFKRIPAFLASLIWALHPIHTEAITYMSATADPLHVVFVLGALLTWKEGDLKRQMAAAGLFVLALMAKETALVTPALLAVMLFFRQTPAPRKSYIETWPLWLIAALYLVARATFLNFNDTYHLYRAANIYSEHLYVRLLTFFATLPDYAQLLVAPSNLHIERYPVAYIDFTSWKVVAGALLLLGSAALVFMRERGPRVRSLAFGVAWFFAAYFPCTGVVIPVNAFFLEHWMYLPTIGLFLGCAEALGLLLAHRKTLEAVAAGLTGVLALGFMFLTFEQNTVWRDPITLYTHILRFEEGTARLYNNLGMAYDDAGMRAMALDYYKKAIDGDNQYAQPQYNYGLLLLDNQNYAEGVAHMKRALEIDPGFYRAAEVLESYYRQTGQTALANEYAKKAKR